MYVYIGIIGRDKTTQLTLALFVIVSDSVPLGERAYNTGLAANAAEELGNAGSKN